MNVLVVDDEELIREALRILLEDEGHHVVLAGTMSKAIREIRYGHIDAVILDLLWEGEPLGLEIARHAHSHGIPMLVLSGADTEEMRRQAQVNALEGVIYWFEKPLVAEGMQDLCAALRSLDKTAGEPKKSG
jgi:DNA-binding response OmpR family regulator